MLGQELKENGLGHIAPKQNRVITTHGFRSTFRDWSADKTDYPSMYWHISYLMKSKQLIYVGLIWKNVKHEWPIGLSFVINYDQC